MATPSANRPAMLCFLAADPSSRMPKPPFGCGRDYTDKNSGISRNWSIGDAGYATSKKAAWRGSCSDRSGFTGTGATAQNPANAARRVNVEMLGQHFRLRSVEAA